MKLQEIDDAFQRSIRDRGFKVDELGLEDGITSMLLFYQQVRVDDCPLEDDGDMLLYQWGPSRLDGDEVFIVDITRQLIPRRAEEPYQLSLTFSFDADEIEALGKGNEWCGAPMELDDFKRFIDESEAYEEARVLDPTAVELAFGEA